MEDRLKIKVIPKASRNRVLIKNGRVVVYVTAPPEKGKANREVLKLLKKMTGVGVEIIGGEKAREKVIKFPLEKDEFIRRIEGNG